MTLVETANSAILPAVRGKQAQIGCSTEPFITQGVHTGVWSEPFINIPKEMGPYAYSTFNVRLDTIQKDPELVRGFVRGMMKSLKFIPHDNHDEAAELAKTQFPTMALDDLKATLARSFADDVEPGRHHQPRRLGHRKVGGHGRRYPQGRRQIRRDHRHELRQRAKGHAVIGNAALRPEPPHPIPLPRSGEGGASGPASPSAKGEQGANGLQLPLPRGEREG